MLIYLSVFTESQNFTFGDKHLREPTNRNQLIETCESKRIFHYQQKENHVKKQAITRSHSNNMSLIAQFIP